MVSMLSRAGAKRCKREGVPMTEAPAPRQSASGPSERMTARMVGRVPKRARQDGSQMDMRVRDPKAQRPRAHADGVAEELEACARTRTTSSGLAMRPARVAAPPAASARSCREGPSSLRTLAMRVR